MSLRSRLKARSLIRKALRNMQNGNSMLTEQAKMQQRKAYNDTISNIRDKLREAVKLFDDAIDMATDNASKWGDGSDMNTDFVEARDILTEYKQHLSDMIDNGWVKEMMDEALMENSIESEITGGLQ